MPRLREGARVPPTILPFDVEDDVGGTDVTHLIGLMDLTEHTCKWPVSGQGSATLFCGAHSPGRSTPYCPEHSERGGLGYGRGPRP